MVHVPYRGGAPAVTDLMAGKIQMIASPAGRGDRRRCRPGSCGRWRSPRAKRSPLLPEVPTVAETLPGFEIPLWNGIVAPAGTPPAAIAPLSRRARRRAAQRDLKRAPGRAGQRAGAEHAGGIRQLHPRRDPALGGDRPRLRRHAPKFTLTPQLRDHAACRLPPPRPSRSPRRCCAPRPAVTVEVLDPVNAETIAAAMPKADAIIVRATPINRAFLAHAPNLRIVRPPRRRLRRGGRAGADRARHPADRHARRQCRLRRRARDDADAERARRQTAGYDANDAQAALGQRRRRCRPSTWPADRAGVGFGRIGGARRAAVRRLRDEGAGARPLHPAATPSRARASCR